MSEQVNHPEHYRSSSGMEVIDIIEMMMLGFHLGNAFKYLARSGHKEGNSKDQDIRKAKWYVQRFRAWYARNSDTWVGKEIQRRMCSQCLKSVDAYIKTTLTLALVTYGRVYPEAFMDDLLKA